MVDGERFQEGIVKIGTYRYETVAGSVKTIPSYYVHGSLPRVSKEQFADALAKGFKLVDRPTVDVKTGPDPGNIFPRVGK